MAFALEHFPTFPYPPSGMQEVGEIEIYLTSLHRSMQEFFSLLPRDIKDGISVVDLDDLANTTLPDPDADRIVFWDDGAGVYTWLVANTGLAISGTNLNLSHLGLEALTDPGADRIFFWDDGETASKWLAPDGTSLEISGTTLQVVADGIDDTHIDWGTGANQVSAVDVPIADAGSYYTGAEVETALQEAMLELKLHQLTGFEDASSVALSTDSGNPPTITLTFTGTVYWWSDGIRYSDSGTDALQIADSSGIHVIYYNGATLSEQAAPSEAQLDAIIRDKAIACIVYFNATTNASYVVASELHGLEMSGETHHWIHDNIGARYKSGLTMSGYTLDTATDAALTFEVTDGEFYDEDLEFDIEDGSAANQYEQQLSGGDASIPVLYRNAGGEWTEQAASTLPYIVSGTTLRFMDADNSYTQTSIQNNYYMNMFLVATNDWQYPIKMIQGTDEYSKQEYSQGATDDEMVDWGTLPSAEWILLYQIILKQSSGESVDGKIVDIIDFRFAGVTGASATSQDHGSLSGLADNDHAQYILHSLADQANDFLIASGADTFVMKTLAETGAILEGDINHDNLQGFVANEHIDWTSASANFRTSEHLAFGGATINVDYGISYNELLTDTDNSGKRGGSFVLQLAKTSAVMTSIAQAFRGQCTLDDTNTQNWTSAIGLRGSEGRITTESSSAGTITGAAAIYAGASIQNAATITNLYGLYIAAPSGPGIAASKVTNEYGIYIDNQAGGATLSYAIYTNNGVVNFGDDVFMRGLKSGTDQADAGAAAGELYFDTNDDNTVKMGV